MENNNNSIKFSLLLKEFADIGLSPDHLMTKGQLFQILDRKVFLLIMIIFNNFFFTFQVHGEFNRDVGEQLFDKSNKNYASMTTVKDFISVYLEGEHVLIQKIDICKTNLFKLIQEKEFYAVRLQEINTNRFEEQISNLVKTSVMRISIIEAQNLNPLGWKSNSSFVYLNCDGCLAQTKSALSTNPNWNETFEL